jgi:DNA repair protein RadC
MSQLSLLPEKSGHTKYIPKHKLLPLRERPVERVSTSVTACTTSELLAALLGGSRPIETADALLMHFKGDLHELQKASVSEITQVLGIGKQNAVRIKAALEIGARLVLNMPSHERPTIQSPADAAALVQHKLGSLDQEYLWVILLDTRNRVIDIVEVYHGNLNSTQVRVAEVFKDAIRRNAASIIACHNHPSNVVDASPDDVAITRALVQAGRLLDVQVLDHLILSRSRFISLKEKRLGFDS